MNAAPSAAPLKQETSIFSSARKGENGASVSRPLSHHVVMREGSPDYSPTDGGRDLPERKSKSGAAEGREERKEHRIKIQDRDREILRVCFEQGFLLPEHIEEFFFVGKSEQSARERVLELEKAGLITRPVCPLFAKSRLIRLTELGESIAHDGSTLDMTYLRRLVPAQLVHDALVTSLRLRLKELFQGRWIPERAIKSAEVSRVPDGLFLCDGGASVALELENSLKGRTRFLRLLKTWVQQPGADFLLFVATTDQLKRLIRRNFESVLGSEKVGVILWPEVRVMEPMVDTIRGEIPLAEIFSSRKLAA